MSNLLIRSVISQGKKIESYLPVYCGKRYKHWNPKFRQLRAKKFIKIDLPDFDAMRADAKMSIEETRSKMKEKGIAPARPWIEKPIVISCTSSIFEPYVPPEGDGKISVVTVEGAKQKMKDLEKKRKSFMAIRKIKQFEDDFDAPEIAVKAQEIYVEAHKAMISKDEDALHLMVTEKCFPELMYNVELRTIRWNFLGSLEPPRVVQFRCTELMTKENVFAQATVRMHTQQTLAIYDRFGRLEYGSEVIVKDVLEYVVFEKHLADLYGTWRIHGKIIPDWLPTRDAIYKTYVKNDWIISGDIATENTNLESTGATSTGNLVKTEVA